MSPGTRSHIGSSCGRSIPARSTAAVDVTIDFKSSAALLDRNSCQNRSKVLSKIIVTRTIIVLKERSSGAAKITSEKSETMLTANSTPLNGVRNAWNSCWYHLGGCSYVTSLGPYCCRLARTCSFVRPLLLACKPHECFLRCTRAQLRQLRSDAFVVSRFGCARLAYYFFIHRRAFNWLLRANPICSRLCGRRIKTA